MENYVNPVIDNKKILEEIDDIIKKGTEAVENATEGDGKEKGGKSKLVHECPECGCKFSAQDKEITP